MVISLIVATSLNGVIGKENRLPWYLPADLQEFKRRTMGHHLLMGSRTFHAIGRLLPGRITIVLSKKMHQTDDKNFYTVNSIADAINLAKNQKESELFVIGGSMVYQHTLPIAHRIYWTKIHAVVTGDTYFPLLGKEWVSSSIRTFKADKNNIYDYEFIVLNKNT